jgi:DNA-binding transcriptional ArsR family regulator
MVESSAPHLDGLFHALSDATRRAILQDIAGKQMTVGEVARPYRMSLAAVSKHLRVLEAAQLVVRERRGSFQVVHLNADALQAAAHWLRFYEQFWNRKLDVLQSLLEGEDHE